MVTPPVSASLNRLTIHLFLGLKNIVQNNLTHTPLCFALTTDNLALKIQTLMNVSCSIYNKLDIAGIFYIYLTFLSVIIKLLSISV